MKKLFILLFVFVGSYAFAAGGACPAAAQYIDPTNPTGSNVTLSSLGVTSCYYIAASGLDTNTGTDEAHPWLHAPGMPNCSNTCSSATLTTGEGFIFRGGDTWHFGNSSSAPYTGGAWTWARAGGIGAPVYVGVDQTWFTGGAWARPILTEDNTPVASTGTPPNSPTVASCAHTVSAANNMILFTGMNNWIFDNFEITGYCWNNVPSFGNNNMFKMFGASSPNNDYFERNYIHGWSRTSAGPQADATAVDSSANTGPGWHFWFNVIDGQDSDIYAIGAFGAGFDGNDIAYNVLRYQGAANVSDNCYTVHDNLFEYIQNVTDGSTHSDIMFCFSEATKGAGSPNTFYNNVFRHIGTLNSQSVSYELSNQPPTGQTDYIFNNVSWDAQPGGSGQFDFHDNACTGCSGALVYFNNTLTSVTTAGTSTVLIGGPGAGSNTTTSVNNHFMTPSGNQIQTWQTAPNTELTPVYMTTANATAQGYTTSNDYQPTVNTNSTVTLAGTNETSGFCSHATLNNAAAEAACVLGTTHACTYNSTSHSISCPDITPPAKPSVGNWQGGAYQFTGGSIATPSCTPGTGTYTSNQTITCTGPVGATVCVSFNVAPTTDGAGHCLSGLAYFEPITANRTEILYAIATQSGQTDSSTASFTYTLNWGTCGPPTYSCNNTSQSTMPLPNPLPAMGTSSTVSPYQYAPGNSVGMNHIVTDNIPTSIGTGLRELRVTDDSGIWNGASSVCKNASGGTIPAHNNYNGDYSGNVTDLVWNTDSTFLIVAPAGQSSYCVVPFNPATFQVSNPVYSTRANPVVWSHMMPTVFYIQILGPVTFSVGSCPSNHWCLVQYDGTANMSSPVSTLLYDYNATGNCLQSSNTITWTGVTTISNDDSTFIVAMNDNLRAGGQDSGYLYTVWSRANGCAVMNTGWAYQSIASGSTTGSVATLTLTGALPDLFYNATTNTPQTNQTFKITGCAGTGYNLTGVTLTSVAPGSNQISYNAPSSSGSCGAGGLVQLMDAGHIGGTIWSDTGTPSGNILLYNAVNSTAGNICPTGAPCIPPNTPNNVGEGGPLHESFAPNNMGYSNGYALVGIHDCHAANPSGVACAGDIPSFWKLGTNNLIMFGLGGNAALSGDFWANSTGTPSGQIAYINPANICPTPTTCVGTIGGNPAETNFISTSGAPAGNNLAGFTFPYGMHISWNNAGPFNNLFVWSYTDSVTRLSGTPAINAVSGYPAINTLPAQSFQMGYQQEISGYPTANPGSKNTCNSGGGDSCIRQMAHTYTSTTGPVFQSQFFVGSVSQDGRYASFTSDWGGGLGATNASSNATILGGPIWVASTAYPANFVITPSTGNTSNHTYQAAGSCTTSSTHPNWTATTVSDNTCTWNYVGDQNARNDAFIVELTPQPSPALPPAPAPMFAESRDLRGAAPAE
jgi:hypothetical protein